MQAITATYWTPVFTGVTTLSREFLSKGVTMSGNRKESRTKAERLEEVAELRARLDEAEQILDAIRSGSVDALVVAGPQGDQIFSLTGAEHVYRVIIEAMNEGALTMDLGGYILFCNRRFCEMVKKPMEAIIGKRLASFAAPPQRHAIRTLVADAQTGPVRRRLILQSGDETPVSVQLSANLLVAAKPPCICMVVSDLTEWQASANSIKVLREQQEALAAAKDRLAADLARMSRLQEISTRLVGQGDLTSLLEKIVQAAMDITGADMGNIQLKDETGAMRIAAHNGFGRPFLDFLNRLHQERTESACSQAIAGCKRVIIEDVTLSPVFAGSPALPVLLEAGVRAVQSTPLVSRSGEIVGMFSTLYRTPRNPGEVDLHLLDLLARQAADLIERMQVIDALNRRSAQLEAANEELESFSYSVSHDLRAPLRAIDGYSRMILRRHADTLDEDALGKFTVIRDNTRVMGQLIDDLLAFSRLGRTHLSMATIEPAGLIREIWEELKAASPDRRLTLKIAAIPPCRGDQGLIKQAFVNILANAVKFTKTRDEALIEVGGSAGADESTYFVRDNGVGFDMQYHDKLFGVFQRLHSADEFEGTGVGLAIVKRIVHRHGGRIWAEGKPGEGATFYVALPTEKAG
jgi:PAS domain S-box-containing protein